MLPATIALSQYCPVAPGNAALVGVEYAAGFKHLVFRELAAS